jgi:hypothetical protein
MVEKYFNDMGNVHDILRRKKSVGGELDLKSCILLKFRHM